MKFEMNGYIASTSLTYRPNRLFAQWSICTMAATMPKYSNLYGPYHICVALIMYVCGLMCE